MKEFDPKTEALKREGRKIAGRTLRNAIDVGGGDQEKTKDELEVRNWAAIHILATQGFNVMKREGRHPVDIATELAELILDEMNHVRKNASEYKGTASGLVGV